MPAAAICLSHGGLMNVPALLRPDELSDADVALDRLRRDAVAFAPDLVIQFGNDHNSGFSLTLMPQFMVALRARTLGDFDTSSAEVKIDEARGRALVRHLHEAGVDVATSYDALFDHGFTMALDKLFGGVDRVPAIPVFINCGGDLRPPLHRALALGKAIGYYCAQHFSDLRILYLGSGGLSHDPPLPEFETAPPDVRQRMIAGTAWTEAALAERTRKVTEVGAEHGRGEGDLQPLNEEWDRAMLRAFAVADLEGVASQSDRDVIAIGGRGGSEIRNWIAALAALRAHGGGTYRVAYDSYRALPAWIVGFATLYAEAA